MQILELSFTMRCESSLSSSHYFHRTRTRQYETTADVPHSSLALIYSLFLYLSYKADVFHFGPEIFKLTPPPLSPPSKILDESHMAWLSPPPPPPHF